MNMRKIVLSLILSIVMSCMSGFCSEMVPLVNNVYARNPISLNGDWHYIVDVQEEGYYDYRRQPLSWGFFRNAKPQKPSDLIEYDFSKSPTMHIPGDWNTQDASLFFYEGTVWFGRDFEYKKKDGVRTLLYIGAVNYDSHVFLNGKEVGAHIGGFTPFNIDVTEEMKDGSNFICIKADNKRSAESVPTLIFDWWNYGGITRDVLLVEVGERYVENYKIRLDNDDLELIHFELNLNKKIRGENVRLRIPELNVNESLQTDRYGSVEKTLRKRAELWSPENPKLYKVYIDYNGRSIEDEIGFRSIKTVGKQILLNGKPIFLKGISVHEEKAYGGGRANSTDDARLLISWAKELGCNYMRFAHYPHNEFAVREAERQGMLVWSEIPVYWTIDWTNTDTYLNAENQLREMITRDWNRCNIIIWSIANETPHGNARDRFLSRLSNYAKSLDDSRLISMAMEVSSASNYVNRLNDNMNKYVDVISFNQYVGWYRDVHDAPKMTWEIPYDKPVIISEFGGGAKYGYHGDKGERWTEEFQENLYKENLAMFEKIDGLAGMTPWILKDFRSPRRVLPGVQDYYNRKGLFSDNGEKKLAFYVLRDWYSKR